MSELWFNRVIIITMLRSVHRAVSRVRPSLVRPVVIATPSVAVKYTLTRLRPSLAYHIIAYDDIMIYRCIATPVVSCRYVHSSSIARSESPNAVRI